MSAQAGLWYFDGRLPDRELLKRIDNALMEYGPDGGSVRTSGPIWMLYKALHTTRESRIERQPYESSRSNVMMWDGILDNRDELVSQLSNDLTGDRTDVAIVMAAYERWNTECFRKLI